MKKRWIITGLLIFLGAAAWGIPYTSTGVGTGAWSAAATWFPNGVPGPSDDVTIQDGHTVTLTAAVPSVASVTIDSGGELALGSFNITISTFLKNDGTIRLQSPSATPSFQVTVSSNTYIHSSSTRTDTIIYDHAANSILIPLFDPYYNLTVTGTGTQLYSIGSAGFIVNGTATIGKQITTTGGIQVYNGQVTLTEPGVRLLSGAGVTFAASGLAVTSTAASLSVMGSTIIGADVTSITTGGYQIYNNSVMLTAPLTPKTLILTAGGTGVTFSGATAITGNGNNLTIDGNAAINGAVSRVGTLTLNGATTHGGGAGAIIAPDVLTINSGASLTQGSAAITTSALNINGGALTGSASGIMVSGSWANTGTFTPGSSPVIFASMGPDVLVNDNTTFGDVDCIGKVTFNGSNTINTLTCGAGSTGVDILFADGVTQNITTIDGGSSTPTNSFDSVSGTTRWNLNLPAAPGSFINGAGTTIENCYSINALGLTDPTDAINGGNNIRVFNTVNSYRWLGGTNTDWDTTTNWDTTSPYGGYPGTTLNDPAATLIIDKTGNDLTTNVPAITVGMLTINNGTLQAGGAISAGTVSIGASQTLDLAGYNLTVSSNAVFNGNVTNVNELQVSGRTDIGVTGITTTGTQTYNGPVVLGANAVLTAGTAPTPQMVTFGNTVTNTGTARTLTVGTGTIASNATFNGNVGGGLALTSVYVYGTTAINTANITTTGTQTYNGPVVLGANAVLTAGTAPAPQMVTFGNTVTNTGTARTLTVGTGTIASNATFNGNVGGGLALTSVYVYGTTAINTANITTSGTQTYTGTVTLGGATGTKTLVAGGTGVTFSGATAVTGGGNSLTITGSAAFNGNVNAVNVLQVSGIAALGAVTLNIGAASTAATLSVNGAAVVNGSTLAITNAGFSSGASLTGTGTVSMGGAVTATTTKVTVSGTALALGGTLAAPSHAIDLRSTNDSAAGTIAINGAITGGAITIMAGTNDMPVPPTPLSLGPVTINANITAAGALRINTTQINYTSGTVTGSSIDAYVDTALSVFNTGAFKTAVPSAVHHYRSASVTYTWTGAGAAATWTAPANWDTNGVPSGTGYILVVARTGTFDPTTPGALVIGSLTITTGTLTLGAAMTTDTASVALGQTFVMAGYTCTVLGTAPGDFTNNGTVSLAGSGTQFPGSKPSNAAGTNAGNIILTGASSYTELDGTGFTNLTLAGGGYTVKNPSNITGLLMVSGGSHTAAANATVPALTIAGGTFTPAGTFSVTGAVSQTGGTLALGANTLNAGTAGTGAVNQTAPGIISGTAPTINAATGISMVGANTAGSVTLTTTTSGNISYTAAAGTALTVSAVTFSTTPGTVTITAPAGITVAAPGILGTTITLTSSNGSVGGAGVITGAGGSPDLTVNARDGINLTGDNNVPAVHLLNTQDTSQTGNIAYTSKRSASGDNLTVNAANGAPSGTISITEKTGNIVLGAGGGASGAGGLTTNGGISIITNNDSDTSGGGKITLGQAVSNGGGAGAGAISISADNPGNTNPSGGIFMTASPTAGSGTITLNGGGGPINGATAAAPTAALTTTNDTTTAIQILNAGNVYLGALSAATISGRVVLGTSGAPITGTMNSGAAVSVTAASLSGYGGVNPVTVSGPIPSIAGYTLDLIATTAVLDITTTGGALAVSAQINAYGTKLTVNGGAITQSAIINGTDLTLDASGAITLANANTVANLGITRAGGAVQFTNGAKALNIGTAAGTGITGIAGNNVTIVGGDDIMMNRALTGSGANTVRITSGNDKNIVFNSGASITAIDRLVLSAGTRSTPTYSSGDVTFNTGSSVTVASNGTEGATAAIYVWARNVSITTGAGSASITPGTTTGQLCLWIDNPPVISPSLTAVAGERYHVHPRNGGHIIYRDGLDTAGAPHGIGTPYFYIDSSSSTLPATLTYSVAAGRNIYIIDVGTQNRTLNFTTNDGFVEFRGAYESSGALNLTTGIIRLVNSDAAPANPADITLTGTGAAGGFTAGTVTDTGRTMQLDDRGGGSSGPASITADTIVVNTVTGTATAGRANNLTLKATGTGTITVNGNMGDTSAAAPNNAVLGDVTFDNAGVFTLNAPITSNGDVKQINAGGTNKIGANITTVTVNKEISFEKPIDLTAAITLSTGTTGGSITLNRNSGTAGATAVTNSAAANLGLTSGGTILINGSVTLNGGLTQTGTSANQLYGDINTSAGNGNVSFAGMVTLNKVTPSILTTINSGTGNVSLTGGINGNTGSYKDLTITAGTGTVTVGKTASPAANEVMGTFTVIAGQFNVNAYGSIQPNGLMTVNGPTQNAGSITAGPVGAGSSAIVFNGNYVGTDAANSQLVGNGTTNPYIDFNSAVVTLSGFTHNGDIIRFTGTTTAHTLSHTGSNSRILGDVIITAGHTVTVLGSKSFVQGNGNRLTLAGLGSILSLAYPAGTPTAANSASWKQGTALAPGGIIFDYGFMGLDGDISLAAGSRLETGDFYNTAAAAHTVTINGTSTNNSNIEAAGNVEINSTFGTPATLINSTLTMTGENKQLRVSTVDADSDGYPDVRVGNFVADGGTAASTYPGTPGAAPAAHGTIIATNVVFEGTITINSGKVLEAGASSTAAPHIYVFPSAASAPPPLSVLPNPPFAYPLSGTPGNTWNQQGQFVYNQSIVEFGNTTKRGNWYSVKGDTAWYNFVCHEPAAIITFSNYVIGSEGHKIMHELSLFPNLPAPTDADMIFLTKEADGSDTPPSFPAAAGSTDYIPPAAVNNKFWYFTLASNARLDINYVDIFWSFSRNKIPVPQDTSNPDWKVGAWPYVDMAGGVPDYNNSSSAFGIRNHWNVNWFIFNNFFYAFTEDANHNGRIDRIRLQSAFDVIGSAEGAFVDFVVRVWNKSTGETYNVTGYRRVDETTPTPGSSTDLDSIYVFLEEKPYNDGDAILSWEIIKNASLWDLATYNPVLGKGSTLVGNDRTSDQGADSGYTVDTVAPRLNYALTVPGHPQLYFQMSEPLDITALPITVDIDTGSSVTPVSDTSEFVVDIMPIVPIGIGALAAGATNFTVTSGGQDMAKGAWDLHDEDSKKAYYFMYPIPKYPRNYLYDDNQNVFLGPSPAYVPVPSFLHDPGTPDISAIPSGWPTTVVVPPNTTYDALGNPGPVTHRVTDMLISVPPKVLSDTTYFVWPLWAKYDFDPYDGTTLPSPDGILGDYLSNGYGYMNPSTGETYTNTDIIWDFSGKRFLEASNVTGTRNYDTTMQVNVNTGLGLGTPALVNAFNVDPLFKSQLKRGREGQGSPGLWLPSSTTAAYTKPDYFIFFFNLVPLRDRALSLPTPPSGTSPGGTLYNYQFSVGTDGYENNRSMEFFFHLPVSPADLYAGRLDVPAGSPLPDNWYRLVRPFSFNIRNITRQRSNATILNNVINPEKDERVYLDYTLNKSGQVTIQVFTLDGNLVQVLERGSKAPGNYRVAWDGKNRGGRAVARGMYFIRIVAPEIDEIRKVMVVK